MDESIAAVVAHGLLNSLAVVHGAVSTLTRAWEGLAAEQRTDLAEMALAQAELMADGLDALPGAARHRLANHLFVVRGACQTLKLEGGALPAGDRQHLLGVVRRQAGQAADVLESVVKALPGDVQVMLNHLDQLDEDRGRDRQAV